ncbi:MAG: glycosyltransferase family 4 protein [Patescibacteria group bacterium]
MIRVLYITRARLSLSRAHTLNIVKTAEAWAAGQMLTPTVMSGAADPVDVAEIFARKGVHIKFFLDVETRHRSIFLYSIRNRQSFDVLYFRDPLLWPVALAARLYGKKVIFEVHGTLEWMFARPLWRLAIASSNGFVAITKSIQGFYHSGKPSIVVHTSGTDNLASVTRDRVSLGMPKDKIVLLYAGSFLWDSIDVLFDTVLLLPESVVLVALGIKSDQRILLERRIIEKELVGRIICIDRVPPAEVLQYLAVADILINPLMVSYPSSISSKLYEYLGAGKPIVTSQGGANEEVIHDGENGLIVKENTPHMFAGAVERIINDPELGIRLARGAEESALLYTWEQRARRITDFIESLS